MKNPYVRRASSVVFSFFAWCAVSLALAHFIPDLRLISAIIVGLAAVWALGNIVSLIGIIIRNEKAAP